MPFFLPVSNVFNIKDLPNCRMIQCSTLYASNQTSFFSPYRISKQIGFIWFLKFSESIHMFVFSNVGTFRCYDPRYISYITDSPHIALKSVFNLLAFAVLRQLLIKCIQICSRTSSATAFVAFWLSQHRFYPLLSINEQPYDFGAVLNWH